MFVTMRMHFMLIYFKYVYYFEILDQDQGLHILLELQSSVQKLHELRVGGE